MANKYELATEVITYYEGFRSEPYYCPSGILTIGFGRTEGVKIGDVTDEQKEYAWLANRLFLLNDYLNKVIQPRMNPYQMSALLSFCYNIGTGAFSGSTMRARINKGDSRAVDEFHRWVKGSDGKPLEGLIKRRKTEAILFSQKRVELF